MKQDSDNRKNRAIAIVAIIVAGGALAANGCQAWLTADAVKTATDTIEITRQERASGALGADPEGERLA